MFAYIITMNLNSVMLILTQIVLIFCINPILDLIVSNEAYYIYDRKHRVIIKPKIVYFIFKYTDYTTEMGITH